MEVFAEYLAHMSNPQHKARMEKILGWVAENFTNLIPKTAWNQPMSTDHGTFIIGFSATKSHLAVAPEMSGTLHFFDDMVQAGYDHTKQLFRIKWDSPVNFSLLERILTYNILDKADCSTFWRK